MANIPLRLERGDVREPAAPVAAIRGARRGVSCRRADQGPQPGGLHGRECPRGGKRGRGVCRMHYAPHPGSDFLAGGSRSIDARWLRQEPDPETPVSHYGQSKLAGAGSRRKFAWRVPITIVRPPIVFGFGDESLLGFVHMVTRRGMHLVPGSPAAHYSLIHASDLALGLLQAARLAARLPAEQDDNQTGLYYMSGDEQPGYDELGTFDRPGRRPPAPRTAYTPRRFAWSVAAMGEGFASSRGQASLINLDKMREATAGCWVCSPSRAKADLGFRVAAPLLSRMREVIEQMAEAGLV